MQNLLDVKSTLLIVENDVEVADMLRSYFLFQGYEVFVANWGEDAVQICTQKPIDIVLLDIRLPDIEGFEVANRLRTQTTRADLPIIFLAEHEKQFRIHGLTLEAQDYIIKPLNLDELHLRIKNAMRHSKRKAAQYCETIFQIDDLVDKRLLQWLDDPAQSLIHIRLVNLCRFQDIYGYGAASELSRLVSRLLNDAITKFEIQQGFVGHLSKIDFILMIPQEHLTSLKSHLHRRLQKTFQYMSFVDESGEDVYRDEKLSCSISLIMHDNQINDLASLKNLLI